SRRRHTRFSRDWSSDVCSSDLDTTAELIEPGQCALGHHGRAVLVVVFTVDIDIEHNGTALQQIGAQKPGLRQIGKAEEGRELLKSEERRVGKEGRDVGCGGENE